MRLKILLLTYVSTPLLYWRYQILLEYLCNKSISQVQGYILTERFRKRENLYYEKLQNTWEYTSNSKRRKTKMIETNMMDIKITNNQHDGKNTSSIMITFVFVAAHRGAVISLFCEILMDFKAIVFCFYFCNDFFTFW